MSKKFWAINRQTGERWKPVRGEYLVMYDSGYRRNNRRLKAVRLIDGLCL